MKGTPIARPASPAGSRALAARFGAAARTYARHAGIQDAVADTVAAMLAERLGGDFAGRILDVGCGTGLLTHRLCVRFPRAGLIAVDLASPLIKAAREHAPVDCRAQWVAAEARALPFRGPFAVIASSSSLHWMTPLTALFRQFHEFLAPEGILVAGLMVDGTLSELHEARRRVAPAKCPPERLPAADAVRESLQAAGFDHNRTREIALRGNYTSAREFFTAIHEQGLTGGAVSHGDRLLTRTELARLIAEYGQCYRDPAGGVYATYRVMYLAGRKRNES